jgi:integrase
MSLYKRNGVWWYHFIFEGRHIQKSSKVGNKRDAEVIEAAYRTQLAKSEVGIDPPEEQTPIPTFKQAMEDFLEWAKAEYAAHPATCRRYVTSSKALLRNFGNTSLDRISSDDVEKFKTWRARQKKAAQGKKSKRAAKVTKQLRPATVNRELACLKHLFKRNDSLVLKNPVKGVKSLDEDNEQTRVLSSDEEKLYLLAASQPLQDIATLMLETGCRPEEIYRIRRENVQLAQGYLVNPFGKTKAAKRQIPLSDAASAVLSKRLAAAKGDYLFPGRIPAGGKPEDAGPIVKVNAAHTAAVIRSKVARFRLYDLRHTWATRMAMAGVDLVTLAAMLGHSKINMVLRYAHPTQEHQFAAMEKRQRYIVR